LPNLKKKHLLNHRFKDDPVRQLSSAELLDIWDSGRYASPCRRSLLLLSAVCPEEAELLAHLPLGSLTGRLLRLRAALFGQALTCLTNCHSCNGTVETTFGVEELLSYERPDTSEPGALHSLTYDDCILEFRLPTAKDLITLEVGKTHATIVLADRVISKSMHNGENIPIQELAPGAVEAIEAQIIELDPLAHIELRLSCPDCGNTWYETLYVIDFLWLEIGSLAKRLLIEIARLASAFGWSEREILALTPERRRSYLELLGA
jgi:hypothetical protein